MLELITAALCMWIFIVHMMTRRSIHVGAFVLARCQVEWGPFLKESTIPASQNVLRLITKKVAPRYTAWIAESAGFLNTLFITGFTTAAVGLLTLFDIKNNAAIYPYILLIIMMLVANILTVIGAYVVYERLQKMSVAHDMLFSTVATLNILQGEDVPEEARADAETILAAGIDVETWDALTQDKIDTDEEED